ncbi:MAG TPA: gliding motility-associated C-terminal domain-containing protein [Chitinophagaceae bacterium]
MVDESCTDTKSITVKTNTPVLCSSIAADGSDFTTDAPANIVSAYGINCTDRGGYTNSIVINFSSALPAGNYTISGKKGTDNNTLKNLCGNDLLPPDPISFIIKPGSKVVIDDESICFEQLPYVWNGITVSNAGNAVATYASKAFAGCDSTTILNLHVGPPPQQKNSSANICDGDFYVLPWDSTANSAGTYSHYYINSSGCDSIIENVTLTVFIPPSGSVQARDSTFQTGFCQHGSILLDAGKNFVSYLWNTGETSQTIIVKIAGAYSLVAKDQYGCNTIDTFAVAAYPRPTADFGTSKYLCADSTVVLNGGKGYTSYLWDDGTTGQTITTNQPGVFWVRLTDAHDCEGTDSVTVIKVERPANFLINSLTKCNYQDANLTSLSDFASYKWSNGFVTKSIKVSNPGSYWLKVTDGNGCTGMDSTTVIDNICPVYLYVPNAFTPNNDGLNDIFKPKFAGPLSGFQFFVYNRWGQMLFSSYDPSSGWDGTMQGIKQPAGVYVWICSYILNGHPHSEKGTVVLIR